MLKRSEYVAYNCLLTAYSIANYSGLVVRYVEFACQINLFFKSNTIKEKMQTFNVIFIED